MSERTVWRRRLSLSLVVGTFALAGGAAIQGFWDVFGVAVFVGLSCILIYLVD